MAVAPGNKILQSDLDALASAANGKTQLPFDVTPMYYDGTGAKVGQNIITGIGIDPANRGSGYKPGDYLQGVSWSTSSSLVVGANVESVDASGGLMGIRIVAIYPGDPAGTWPTSPADFTSPFGGAITSGSGAKITFAVSTVGPNVDYSFPDYDSASGKVTGFVLVDGGTGYAVSDALGFSELIHAVITVATVDGAGKILTWNLTTPTDSPLVPANVAALSATGGTGTGAVFSGIYTLNQKPKWLTELNRLRNNFNGYIAGLETAFQPSPEKMCISGPWPVSGPTANFKETFFYYEETASTEHVTLSDTFNLSENVVVTQRIIETTTWNVTGDGWWMGNAYDYPGSDPGWAIGSIFEGDQYNVPGRTKIINKNLIDSTTIQYNALPIPDETTKEVGLFVSHSEWSLVIGGIDSIHVQGVFYVPGTVFTGSVVTNFGTPVPDSTDPATLVAVSGNFPGSMSKHVVYSGYVGVWLLIMFEVDEILSPGRYTMIFDVTLNNDTVEENHYRGQTYIADTNTYTDDYSSFIDNQIRTKRTRVNFLYNPASSGLNTMSGASSITFDAYGLPTATGHATASIVYDSSELANGIDGSKNVRRIRVPGDSTGIPCGLGSCFEQAVSATLPFASITIDARLGNGGTGGDVLIDPNGNAQWLNDGSLNVTGSITEEAWNTVLGGWSVWSEGSGYPPGSYKLVNLASDPDWLTTPYPQPIYNERILMPSLSITATVPGFWSAISQMVSSLSAAQSSNMPWNYIRTKYGAAGSASVNPMLLGDLAPLTASDPAHPGTLDVAHVSNSYDQSKVVELQDEPPGWVANRYFKAGFTILDSNGNFQTVAVSGNSGSSAPTWSKTHSGSSSDNEITWVCSRVLKAGSTWAASTVYDIDRTIIDSNGNTQTSVDSWLPGNDYSSGVSIVDINGNFQTVSTAGLSGSTQPGWATSVGATTTDGTAVWTCGGAYPRNSGSAEPTWETVAGALTTDLTVTWKLTSVAAIIKPTVHRDQSIPVYPFYWYSETIDRLKPPTATSGLTRWGAYNQWQRNTYHSPSYDEGWQQDNKAKGWWIYSVSLNRITGNTKNGINLPPATQVAVTIGCMRSGSFVSFGTWDTGQTIQVLWPIFTSDALVYQCSERIDLQAVAIIGVATGATASYPVCAAFVSDVTELLGLIS